MNNPPNFIEITIGNKYALRLWRAEETTIKGEPLYRLQGTQEAARLLQEDLDRVFSKEKKHDTQMD